MLLSVLVWLVAVVCVLIAVCVGITAFIKARVEAALPPLGNIANVDGAKIQYLDQGSGPPIVFVHGLAGQMRHWTYALVDRLKDDHRVIVFDRPGCGYSTSAPGASSNIGVQAKTIAGFIRGLGLDRPLLVGHSLGGALSLGVALDHRETIGGLALIAPLTHPVHEVPDAFRLMATLSPLRRFLTSWILATPLSLLFGKIAITQVFGPNAVKDDFGLKGGNFLMLRPSSFVAASSEMVATAEDLPAMAERYASLDCPLGILYGTGDQILDPRHHGEALAQKVPGATIEYIDGAGHMPPQVLPERTEAFVRTMAQRVAKA